MLDTLLESRALTDRGSGGHGFSIVAHCVAIALAVSATHRIATPAPRDTHEAYGSLRRSHRLSRARLHHPIWRFGGIDNSMWT